MKPLITLIALLLFGTVGLAHAESDTLPMPCRYQPEDVQIAERYFQMIEPKRSLPFDSLVVETARFFLHTPYVAGTLEGPTECLTVNLRQMDCTTFVEYVIALARTVATKGKPTFRRFAHHLLQLRYRDALAHGYASRLHYFSDWIFENSRQGFVRDVTRTAGGRPLRLDLHFMTNHPASYPALAASPPDLAGIRRKEREISGRDCYGLIETARIDACAAAFRPGDIVCFATSIDGLDVTHVGFLYDTADGLRFIHASSTAGRVIIDPLPLSRYVKARRSATGIMLVRPIAPAR